MTKKRSIAIIGGGPAGLAAAWHLSLRDDMRVQLFEANEQLGGRAASLVDPAVGVEVDACPHVGLGCCGELLDFLEQAELLDFFRRDRCITFVGPGGQRHPLQATPMLPPPLHLGPSLARLSFLSWRERMAIGHGVARLCRSKFKPGPACPTVGQWLAANGQSDNAVRRFWFPVLVSALGDQLECVSIASAQMVMRYAFWVSRHGWEPVVPTVPLAEIFDRQLGQRLQQRGVEIHRGTRVRQIELNGDRVVGLRTANDRLIGAEAIILSVGWRQAPGLFSSGDISRVPAIMSAGELTGSPITSVHLWFEKSFGDELHLTPVDRLSQWFFRAPLARSSPLVCYQSVVSASHGLVGRDPESIIRETLTDFRLCWPGARSVQPVHARVVHRPNAVFTPAPGIEQYRPAQKTSFPGIYVAGDWTETGWPATIESALRSGRAAAEAVMENV